MKKTNYGGQIIAEVVIAIGLLGLILVGLSDLITKSTVSVRLNKQKDEAARAVDARLSYLKQERDRDTNNFFTVIVNQSTCTWPIAVSFTLTCAQSFTVDANGALVSVTGTWTNKTANDTSVSLSTYITK